MPDVSNWSVILIILSGVVIFTILYFVGSALQLWLQAIFSGTRVGLLSIVFMRFRKVPSRLIVVAKITAVKAGIDISTDDLESHFLAGGNVMQVVTALIAADKADMPLTFKRAAEIDLAGHDVYKTVQMSVNPKGIQAPNVSAVAKNVSG